MDFKILFDIRWESRALEFDNLFDNEIILLGVVGFKKKLAELDWIKNFFSSRSIGDDSLNKLIK